jgi:hypothetical protein
MGAGFGLPGVMLEYLLANGSQRSLQPQNLLIGITIGAIAMVIVKRPPVS